MSFYLLLGFLFAGILYIYFPKKKVYRYLGRQNRISVLNASVIGVPLPLCSCGVIPTGISFYRSGASKGSSVSFLISTPQTGIDSILVTYSLLGLPMAIIKPIIAFITGIYGGIVSNFTDKKEKNAESALQQDMEQDANKDRSPRGMIRYAFVEFIEDIAQWLLIGLLIAALISVLVPDNFFTLYLGNPWLEMLLVLVAAVPLYVCATGSVPIAAALMLKGLSPGAAIVFLMAGPATNAATMTVIGKVMGRKTLLVYLFSIITGALLFGFVTNQFLPKEWFTRAIHQIHGGEHAHGILPRWLQIASSVLLGLLLINGLWNKYKSKILSWFRHPEEAENKLSLDMKSMNVIVNGMTCNHCKANVENAARSVKGVESAEADIVANRLVLEGEDINLDEVKSRIEEVGYEYGGQDPGN